MADVGHYPENVRGNRPAEKGFNFPGGELPQAWDQAEEVSSRAKETQLRPDGIGCVACAQIKSLKPTSSAIEIARRDIMRLEESLKPALQLARIAYSSAVMASEKLGEQHETGASHSCLGLMEIATRALNQANDAARYSRHSLRYPAG